MRTDIEFNADGTILRGWLYRPDGADGDVPAVVMAHGLAAVKEMYLDAFAEVFAGAGLAAVVFDHRGFGASRGEPRQDVDPWQQVEDYRDAITFARSLPGIDRERIGVWGTSFSGGHSIVLGAIDRRIRCVVSQVPFVSGSANTSRLIRPDLIGVVRAMLDAEREARLEGKDPGTIPVVSEDPMAPCALPTTDSWEWFSQTGATLAQSWRNEITFRSMDKIMAYEPGAYIEHIAPTPFRLVVARDDLIAPPDLALAAYQRAREPKSIIVLPVGHFDAYVGPGFELASAAARDWFVAHLRPGAV
jgi:uncharacterized protein